MVDYATQNALWELLLRGVRVFINPAFRSLQTFFEDRHYSLIGSANLTPQLRLNFELLIEVKTRASTPR
jgi:phosphatidylserine/phosphatidylglycerophosphate/cardiolipin synthase-like enzyme